MKVDSLHWNLERRRSLTWKTMRLMCYFLEPTCMSDPARRRWWMRMQRYLRIDSMRVAFILEAVQRVFV